MLLEINRAGFEEFSRIDLANKMEFVISYDFHFIHNGRSRMVNHRLTPLALNSKGQLWLALASFSLSPRKHFGNVRMWRVTESGNGIVGNRDVREYSLVDGKWHDSTPIVLTETEQQLLMMSAQGYTTEEIYMSELYSAHHKYPSTGSLTAHGNTNPSDKQHVDKPTWAVQSRLDAACFPACFPLSFRVTML